MSTANRVIKNTGYLYAKMAITMFISLAITRMILNSLGASDFGIFQVVGGSIAMLGFLNAAMASATQRFMSYSEGAGDKEKQKRIFNVSLILHFGLSFIVCVALLGAGWFFFHGILNLPEGRTEAAEVVYGSLIVSTMFTVMSVPYAAMLNAHENMLYYSIVGVFESLMKLGVAFATVYTMRDKLIVYGVLMACVPLVSLTVMRVYCHKHYKECVFAPRRYWDKGLMKEMTLFAGWNLMGSTASALTMQGMAIVLNSFWGVVANAAHGVASQLSGQIMVFSNNMLKALNPVITKKEGAHERNSMLEFSMTGNKLSFIILSFLAIPFIIEMPYIAKLWLKNPPEYTVLFCRLVFLRLMIGQLSVTFATCIRAVGIIRNVTICESLIWASILPLSIFVFWMGAPIYSIYLLLILLVVARDGTMLYFMKKLCQLRVRWFITSVVVPCGLTGAAVLLIGYFITLAFPESFVRLVVNACVLAVMLLVLSYKVCFNRKEKDIILNGITLFYKKIKNKRL